MAGTLIKKVMLRIASDDGDTESKLDRISAKADELGRKHPDLKVKIDTGAAAAKLAVLKRELRDVDKEADQSGGRMLALKDAVNVLTLGLSGGWGEMSMFQKVMAGMSVATGLGEPLVAGLTVALGGLSAGLVSAGAGLGVFGLVAKSVWSGVSSNISAAYAAQQKIAAGATGKKLIADNKALLASLKGLNEGQKSLVLGASNAELAWHNFVQHSAAGVSSVLVPALDLVPKALALMKPFLAPVESALRGIVSGLGRSMSSGGLKSFMDVMSKNAGPMLTDLAHAIENIMSGLGGILKTFMPVAHSMMGGLDSITAKFAKWGNTLGSHSGFHSLMAMFKSETPLAVNVLKQLGGIIKVVVSQMTGMSTFSNSKMLLQLALPILKLVDALLKAHPQLVWLILYLKLAADSGKKLKVAFTGVSDAISGLAKGKQALSDLKSGFTDAEAAASDASGAWGSMGGKLSTVLTKLGLMKAAQAEATVATEGETAAQGELDVAMDANPIGLIIIAVAALAGGIYELAKHSEAFRAFWKGAWADIKTVALDVFHVLEPALKVYVDLWKVEWDIVKAVGLAAFHVIMDAVKLYVDFWKVQWDVAKVIVMEAWRLISDYIRINVDAIKVVLSWFTRLGSLFLGWFMDAARAVQSATGTMLSFVRSIPGRIISALASLGSMMFNAGAHAIESLIGGITSRIGSLGSTMSGVASKIAGFIGLSPAKEGPLSGGGAPFIRGSHIAADIAAGMMSRTSEVGAAGAAMARAAAISGSGGTAGAGGGLQVQLIYPKTGNAYLDDLFSQLRAEVRHRGGGGNDSAQRAFAQITAG